MLHDAPDFLGIGMQKAGTSWLHDQLKIHPQIWLPNRKELHFFDGFSNNKWHVRRQNKAIKSIIEIASVLAQSAEDDRFKLLSELEQHVQMAKPKSDFQWYRDFWRKMSDPKKLSGEITPAYSILNTDMIRRIHEELRVRKVLLILRDPVERAWSQLKMMTERRGNKPEGLHANDEILERSRAKSIVQNWESVYSEGEIFIGFYEDIRDRPHWFLEQVCGFLNVSYSESYFPQINTPVRVSRTEECPQDILDFYLAEFSEDIRYLANRFQGHALGWAERYQLNPK